MKKWLALMSVILPLGLLTGCEPWPENEDDIEIKFINKSDYNVSVTPQARSGWNGFTLAPGERKVLKDVYDVFFTWEPRYRVEVGNNEEGRVVFINTAGATEAGGD